MDAYKVLNISATSTKAEIRSAYRKLARRWHPDRFPEGPEREWANEKMAEINSAYRLCMQGNAAHQISDTEKLQKAVRLIDNGDYREARKHLMSIGSRCAEWNYLFGLTLMHLHEKNKAKIYLEIASHQNPEEKKYRDALNLLMKGNSDNIVRKILTTVRKLAR